MKCPSRTQLENKCIQKLLKYHKDRDYWVNCDGRLCYAGFSPVTGFETQRIKLVESAEQLKEATEVTFSKKTCADLFTLIQIQMT